MKRINQLLFLIPLTIIFAVQNFSQQEKIYKSDEVDKKAVIKKVRRPKAAQNWNCPRAGKVVLRIVLQYSGKVTNVELMKGLSCSYDEKAIEAARKIQFTPAMKDGIFVSQIAEVEYSYGPK